MGKRQGQGVAKGKGKVRDKYLQFINVVPASVIEIGFVKSNRIIVSTLRAQLAERFTQGSWEL